MTAIKALNTLIRLAGTAALVLELALWSGRFFGLFTLHMALGATVVLALWGLAVLAWRRSASCSLAAAALAWGLATLAFGPAQRGLLLGEFHWIVQVVHLLLGLGAIALGAVLARSLVTFRPPASSGG